MEKHTGINTRRALNSPSSCEMYFLSYPFDNGEEKRNRCKTCGKPSYTFLLYIPVVFLILQDVMLLRKLVYFKRPDAITGLMPFEDLKVQLLFF